MTGAERSDGPSGADEIPARRFGRLRQVVFDHFLTKMFSLFFAVVVWFYVNTRSQAVEQLVLPVSYRGKPEALAFVGNPTDQVEIRVRGREVALRTLDAGAISVVVDLSGAKPGDNLFVLGPGNIHFPSDVEIGRISPKTINVRMEPLASKQLGVAAVLVGRPAQGLRVARVSVRPTHVTVRGPRSLLEGMERVSTEPIDLENRQTSFGVTVGLDLAGGRLRIAGKDSEIHVQVILARKVPSG